MGQDVLANWGDFLRIRHELIHAWTAEGKHPAEIAHSLSMDQMQVRGIAMTPCGPRDDDPRWSLLRRASVASPTSAIPRALPQDRDAAVGGLRDEVLAAMPIIHSGHSGPLEWEQCETLRCRRLRAALARLAPPRAPEDE